MSETRAAAAAGAVAAMVTGVGVGVGVVTEAGQCLAVPCLTCLDSPHCIALCVGATYNTTVQFALK